MAACGDDRGLSEWIYLREEPTKEPSIRIRFSNSVFEYQTKECGAWSASSDIPVSAGPEDIDATDSPYTPANKSAFLNVDTSAGNVTILLPADGVFYEVRKANANGGNVIIDGNGVNINGQASVGISNQYTTLAFKPAGSEWGITA